MQQASKNLDYRTAPDNRNIQHIPGENGLPFIGKTIEFVRDLHALTNYHVKKYGHVSRIGCVGQVGLLVTGADNYQKIFLDRDRNFSTEMGYAQQLGQFYKGGVLLQDFDEHRAQRRLLQNAFKNQAMSNYCSMMNPIMKQHLQTWGDKKDFVFFPHIKQTLLEVGAKVFIGIDDMGRDGHLVNEAFLEINEGLLGMVRKEIPGTAFARGQKAKRFLHDFFAKQIPERRKNDGADMFSIFCKETKENGEFFSDQEIIEHMAFLLFAAHDTTTSVLCSLAKHLGMDQGLQQRMRDASVATGKAELSYEDLDGMVDLDNAFHEALRLYPSVSMMTRRTINESELGGFKVPANTMIFLPNMYNHRDPTWWSNPETFDPDRFSPERAEHKRHSFCYTPFGGGAHKCIGMHFANMLVKCFMHQFLQAYKFSTPPGYNPKTEWVPLPKPADGVPLKLERVK